MKQEKLEELKNAPIDVNSPESQEFLRQIHQNMRMATKRLQKMVNQWKQDRKIEQDENF